MTEVQRELGKVGVLFAFSGGPFAEAVENLEGVETLVLGLKGGMDVNPVTIWRAVRFMSEYDIVHLHSINYVLVAAALIARRKIIYTFHGLTHLRRKLSVKDKFKLACLGLFVNNFFHALTANSHFMEHEARKFLGIKKDVRVIYNITPEAPAVLKEKSKLRYDLGIEEDESLALTYSRIVHNKRIDLLLEAASLLKERGVQNIKVLIIGDGPHKPILIKKVSALNLEKRVSLMPFTKNIFDYVYAADFCVFPSHHEPFGIVALEALSLGKPVVVMKDGGGLVEVIGAVADARYVAHDVEDLADKIEDLVQNPEMLSQDSQEFINRSKDFESSRIAGQYGEVYTRALRGNGK